MSKCRIMELLVRAGLMHFIDTVAFMHIYHSARLRHGIQLQQKWALLENASEVLWLSTSQSTTIS